ncbi:MAG: sulfatase-like hydrolase/transferase [Planctomycetaceae bacterium]|nr:sulfatase-like hydrolase/transferase [Planctomycetaceae bacterium]
MGFHDLYEGTQEVFKRDEYFPDLVTARAVRYIDDHKDHPFFLYCAFNIPHYPEQPDATFDERYKNLKMPRQSYAKMVSTVDDRMGQIMQRLAHHGLTENTIVIFMSDNGHSVESYQISQENHNSGLPKGANYGANGGGGNTGKWIGHKGNFYEGGIRVPAILSYPAKLPKGEVRDQAITAMDWMPTILELCNIARPDVNFDGKSLVPVIQSPDAPSPHTTMFWQWQNKWAVRDGDWKLIGVKNNPQHLGNLAEENPEVANHLKDSPEIVTRLYQLHKTWLKDVDLNATNKQE